MNYQQALRVLHLTGNESEEQRKLAKRKALRKSHPDMGGSEESFIIVQEAIEVLENGKRASRVEKVLKFDEGIFSVKVADYGVQ